VAAFVGVIIAGLFGVQHVVRGRTKLTRTISGWGSMAIGIGAIIAMLVFWGEFKRHPFELAYCFLNTSAPACVEEETSPNPSLTAQTGPSSPTSASNPAEALLWEDALKSKTRPKILEYLRAYPEGAFALRAQSLLATCRNETQKVWVKEFGETLHQIPYLGEGPVERKDAICNRGRREFKSMTQDQLNDVCKGTYSSTTGALPNLVSTGSRPSDLGCYCWEDFSSVDRDQICAFSFTVACQWDDYRVVEVEVCG
jgi:hypothetical protein